MFPRLFEGAGVSVPAYFAFVALAFAVGIVVARRWAAAAELDRAVILDLGLLALVVGVIGARIFHVLFDGHLMDYVHLCIDPSKVLWRIDQGLCARYGGKWDAGSLVCHPATSDCWRPVKFWSGGLTLYGGVFFALPFSIWFLRREGFPVLRTLDFLSIVSVGGVALGRVGCFLGGCCFGRRWDGWWAVSFPAGSPASLHQWREGVLSSPWLASHSVHPTQLYEVGLSLLLVAALSMLYRSKHFPGQVMLAAAAGYASLRFMTEFLRADERGALGPFSTSQWFGIAVLIAVMVAMPIIRRKAQRH